MFLCIWGTQISEKQQIHLRIRAGMAERLTQISQKQQSLDIFILYRMAGHLSILDKH